MAPACFYPFFFFSSYQTQEKPHVCTLSSPRDGLQLWEQMWVGSHMAIKGPYCPVALGLVSREAAKLNCLKKDPQPVGPPSPAAGLRRETEESKGSSSAGARGPGRCMSLFSMF